MASNCYVKRNIIELDISDQLKAQISKLILNDDCSSTESSLSDYEDNGLNAVKTY